MINFISIDKSEPLLYFKKLYEEAHSLKQEYIEAICISSYNKNINKVRSRFVNLKYVKEDKFYFFSNYESQKSKDFLSNNQVSITIFWSKTNTQIRIEGCVHRATQEESDSHFKGRSIEKNALAISSMQSKKIASYEDVNKKYIKTINSIKNKSSINRPVYWGGFYVKPNKIEFWEGHENRINKRQEYKKLDSGWSKYFLEP